jgi:hypothetical protein
VANRSGSQLISLNVVGPSGPTINSNAWTFYQWASPKTLRRLDGTPMPLNCNRPIDAACRISPCWGKTRV